MNFAQGEIEGKSSMKFFALFALLAFSSVAYAQEFQTDIPGKTSTPFTVPAGTFQVETDLGNFSQTSYGNYSQRSFQTADPTLKYGLTDSLDIEASFGGYENVWSREGKTTVRLSGFGDITPRIRWTFLTADGLDAGVIAGIKIPTASRGIGNGQVEYSIILPIQYALPRGFSLQTSPEIDVLNEANGTGKQINYIYNVSLSHTIYGNLSGYVELFGQHGTDHYTKDVYTADTGVEYMLTPTSAVTASVYAGLDKYAPQFETVISVAKRF
jgi:hypothetical protein